MHNKTGSQICELWQRAAEEGPGCSNLTRKELDILKNFYWPVWTGNGKSDHSHRQAAVLSLLTFKCHLVSSENQGNANNRALGKRVMYEGYLMKTNMSWLPFLYTSIFVGWNSHSSILLIDKSYIILLSLKFSDVSIRCQNFCSFLKREQFAKDVLELHSRLTLEHRLASALGS